ncbi:MAG: methyl-accepting chemotaxis protein, partial [Marinobacter sp.]|nr:methyl-accepting chemotaxis protein [Marinobacter sp.]
MKELSLRFKLYALVITLLLVMGGSIVVTAQLSLGDMEKRITTTTRDTVQGIVMERLSATAGKYGELVSGQFATAYRTPEVVRNVIIRNIQADSSGRISR